jgi:MFS family permease
MAQGPAQVAEHGVADGETIEERGRRHAAPTRDPGPRYKWIALSNTTLGMLIATINSSIVLIALPDIFKGININPLDPGNTSYLLWMMMGFLVVTAVLVVSFGRLGDMYGRARMYNLGFAIFTVSSVLLAVTWMSGDVAALWLIFWRIVQGIGGAFLMANSSAILTDAFPATQRGLALGINGVAAIAGSFLGLVVGGVLAPVNWHWIFLVSVPFGLLGTVWAYLKLRDTGVRQHARMDWWGNITFAVGLIAVLVAINYGIQPYGGHTMGWTNPWVLGSLIGGAVVLVIFGVIEVKIDNPLFDLSLFRVRSFSAGNLANLMASLGRGGLQFILIIWLQGIWLPLHGYSFESTPLWAGIYMLPMTVGFLLSAPVSGALSDRLGSRVFASVGMVLAALSFLLLDVLPVDFNYWAFAALLFLNGLGMGLFSSPNRAEVMNSLPGNARGVGAGMTATFQNSAMVLSIGIFFSLIIVGLSANLPGAMNQGLVQHGVSPVDAERIAGLPAVAVLFAAFLGYNPVRELLGPVLQQLPPDQAAYLTGRSFFPHLIAGPFADGLRIAFWFAIATCVVAAVASWLCSPRKPATPERPREPVGAELAAVAGGSGSGPSALVAGDGGVLNSAARLVSGTVRMPDGSPVGRGVVTVTGRDGRQVARGLVGADGAYALTSLSPGTYTAIASAPGLRPDAVVLSVPEHGGTTWDVVLHGNCVITGTVKSEVDGPGLAEVAVLVTAANGHVVAQTVTGPDGSFELTALPHGELVVTADAPQHRPAAVVVSLVLGSPMDLDLVLPSAGEVHGAVSGPGGTALAGATVTVVDATGAVVTSASTDEHGNYRVGDLVDGEYTVVTSLFQPATARVALTAGGTTEMDVVLGQQS